MALKPNLSFWSCDNPVIGIMNVEVRIKKAMARSAIDGHLIASIVPIKKYLEIIANFGSKVQVI